MWPFIVFYGVTILGLAGLGQCEILSGAGDEGFVGAAYEKVPRVRLKRAEDE